MCFHSQQRRGRRAELILYRSLCCFNEPLKTCLWGAAHYNPFLLQHHTKSSSVGFTSKFNKQIIAVHAAYRHSGQNRTPIWGQTHTPELRQWHTFIPCKQWNSDTQWQNMNTNLVTKREHGSYMQNATWRDKNLSNLFMQRHHQLFDDWLMHKMQKVTKIHTNMQCFLFFFAYFSGIIE